VSALLLALAGTALGVSFDLEANAAYGAGSRSAFGGVASITVGSALWENKAGVGALEFGFLAGYQVEPYSLQGAYLPQARVTGSTHRFEGLFLVGHGVRLLASRRLLIGLHLFGGWTQVVLRGRLVNESLGLDRAFAADAGRLTTGLSASLGVRLTERVSLSARVLAPFPYASEVISYVIPTLGVAVRL
jgi:hypothetical protein